MLTVMSPPWPVAAVVKICLIPPALDIVEPDGTTSFTKTGPWMEGKGTLITKLTTDNIGSGVVKIVITYGTPSSRK